jgi:hypothetical protein
MRLAVSYEVIVPLVAAIFAACVLVGMMIIEDVRKHNEWKENRRRDRERQRREQS